MAYVDGFVLVVPKAKRAAYKKMATEGRDIWMKHGALQYVEARLNQAKPKWVTFTFPIMAKAKKNEEVWFSYIVYKDKKQRDTIKKLVDKEMAEFQKKSGKSDKQMMAEMPFDMKRMAFGGFTVEVEG